MVRPIVAPTVPRGEERVRICLHAANTVSEVDGLIRKVEEWVISQLALASRAGLGKDGGAVAQGLDTLVELTRKRQGTGKPRL